jgi:2-dehydropantoate 2-reductase
MGGLLGASLHRSGAEVVLACRGAMLEHIAVHGLRVETPGAEFTAPASLACRVQDIDWSVDDCVLLCVKSQDTHGALQELSAASDVVPAIICVQNGVRNETEARRSFPRVYGACVMTAASYLTPGIVGAPCSPYRGTLDVGIYPGGVDDTAARIAADLEGANFLSRAVPDIMRWKYAKLIVNVKNVVEVLCGRDAMRGKLAASVRDEAMECLDRAGITPIPHAEFRDRSRAAGELRELTAERAVNSSWQSIERGSPSVETDYLNGEIVLARSCDWNVDADQRVRGRTVRTCSAKEDRARRDGRAPDTSVAGALGRPSIAAG